MNKCARCGKTVYPTEELKCLDKLWHKTCFKCDECGMALSMKNYKGYNKIPYCSTHYPQVKATTVTETPESRRLAENTRLQSQVKYHEDFEKSKGKFTQVSDDPETMRVMNTHKIISNASYHGDLEKKKEMEQRRLYLPDENASMASCQGNQTALKGQSSQSNRHQVFVQPQMVMMPQKQGNQSSSNRVQQPQSQNQFSSSIKILSQGNKPMDMKQQNQRQSQQPINGTKQQFHQSMSQADQYQVQSQPTVKMLDRQPQQYVQQSSDFNQNNHSSPVRSAAQTVGQKTTQQPQSQHQQRLSQTNQQHHAVGNSSGSYSIIYDGSGHKQVIDNSKKVGSIHDYDPANNGSGNAGYPIKGRQHYQPQLPNYGAAVQQQQQYQMMMQQQYLLQQQMPYNQTGHHGSPVRTSSSGVMPAPQAASSLRVRAIYDYSASDVDEVSFMDGDLIVDCIPIDEGWMTGTVHRTGQRGMLPANYVESA